MIVETGILEQTIRNLTEHLLSRRCSAGHWRGHLSSSALSTATALFALALIDKTRYRSFAKRGLDWLAANQNADGGWGDTVISGSNISTTMLCWAAFTVVEDQTSYRQTLVRVEKWLVNRAGSLRPAELAEAVTRKYGEDRTFSVPILTMCALAGRLGDTDSAWKLIRPLAFEFAVCPRWVLKSLRLSVVSYALPALIAIGQVHYYHRKPRCPVKRLARYFTRRRTLKLLDEIQPSSGGFLEAAPLTSFVVMSLAAAGQMNRDVVSKGVEFLTNSVRDDGSWPIDTNLATWVTTLSVSALSRSDDFGFFLSRDDRVNIQRWLLGQQYRREHPYTAAAAGGWAWTDLPGGVPDADDTAGALIALSNLGLSGDDVTAAAEAGINWLLGLQNKDGGIPTFCRGWMKLAFDQSAPDLTAHAVAAFDAWYERVNPKLQTRIDRAIERALVYLSNERREDGSWTPLWFGNESAPDQANPVYGTSRVLIGLSRVPDRKKGPIGRCVNDAVRWLISVQNPDGGWSGAKKTVGSSIEETALAVDALAGVLQGEPVSNCSGRGAYTDCGDIREAVMRGAAWLIDRTEQGRTWTAAPIGLYFAKLWYYEEIYPVIFALSALSAVHRLIKKGFPVNLRID